MAVKKAESTSAGHRTDFGEVRTLAWLFRTSTYLFTSVLDADLGAPDPRFSLAGVAEPDEDELAAGCARPPLNQVHNFLCAPGFRVRSLARDLSFLNYRPNGRNDAWCLELLERVVRCYVLLQYECRATRDQPAIADITPTRLSIGHVTD